MLMSFGSALSVSAVLEWDLGKGVWHKGRHEVTEKLKGLLKLKSHVQSKKIRKKKLILSPPYKNDICARLNSKPWILQAKIT